MNYIKVDINNGEMNCYLVFNEGTREAGIIDPGDEYEKILKNIEDNNLIPKYILLTHSHGDHIGSIGKLQDRFPNLKLGVHKDEAHMLADPNLNLSGYILREAVSFNADFTFEDGVEIYLGDEKLTVIHVPGHSPGGACFLVDDKVFVGDVLFKRSIGRSDLYGGDGSLLVKSIEERLMILPDEYLVFPGHGPDTTIGGERQRNPFLR